MLAEIVALELEDSEFVILADVLTLALADALLLVLAEKEPELDALDDGL